MEHNTKRSARVLDDLLPGLTENGVTDGHHQLIRGALMGGSKQLLQLPGVCQDPQHRNPIHQRTHGQTIVEKAHHQVAISGNGIGHGAAMAAGSKD
jgi:hypothetical protein